LTAAVVLGAPAAYFAAERWHGMSMVRKLCARDGGEQIFATTRAEGYLRQSHRYFCGPCVAALAKRKFRYIDIQTPDRSSAQDEYFRYTLAARGSDRCETWRGKQANAERLLREAGLREDECVVVTRLSERPVEHALLQRGQRLPQGWVVLGLNQWTVVDERSGELLARVNDYQFVARITALMDMSGHGGNADEKCLKGNSYVRSVSTLAERVLGNVDNNP
jgi:hypothetical protein